MSATVEDDHLIFTQKFSSGYNLFVYAVGYNNVVGLIHPTPESADTPEAYIFQMRMWLILWEMILQR